MSVAPEELAVDGGNHVVQFYEQDSELVESVGRYVADAAQAGGATILIATAAHRQAFTAELEARGVDAETGRRDGTLVLLDAATTMAGFMSEGRIDREAFREVIVSPLREAGEAGRPVYVYGEMVALLWEAGDVLGAIELEKLWNELGEELEFSLLCGYHAASVQDGENAEALREVCELHSSVLSEPMRDASGPRSSRGAAVSAEFPAEPDAPRCARHLVAGALRRWGHAGTLVENAELLVSELATNAVIHARTPFSVVAHAEGSGVRVSVHDASPVEPTIRDNDPVGPSGRGLRLVAELSANWGVDTDTDGKTVWADLHP